MPMDVQTLGFALAAGMVAALNPCGFAMLPAYLVLVVVGTDGEQRSRIAAVGRALVATAAMALGFVLVFGTFGLLIAPLAISVQQYLPVVTVLIGAGLVVLGAWMLTGRELTAALPTLRHGTPTARLGSLFGYGLAYAIASLSCTIGPFLVVTSATFRTGSVLDGVLAYLTYGLGMTLVVGVLAIAAALASTAVLSGARRLLPYVNRIAGGLLVLVGAYVGYYGSYELRLFHGDGDPGDPVVEAAGGVAQVLVGWVDQIGALPLVIALIVLVAAAAVVSHPLLRRVRSRRRARRGSDPTTTTSGPH